MKLAGIIVLYNELLEDSLTFKTLKEQNIELFIWDNSEDEALRKQNGKYENYYSLNRNVGLALAYNKIIQTIAKEYDFVVTMDSDTRFDENFVDHLLNNLSLDSLVYFPKIYDQKDNYISPLKGSGKYKTRFLKKIEPIEKDDYFVAINSGAVYHTSIFDKVQFDERLLVENIDLDMCRKLKQNKIKQKKMDIVLRQNLSSSGYNDLLDNKRIHVTYKDMITFFGKSWYIFAFLMYANASRKSKKMIYLKSYKDIYLKK